MAKKSLLDEYKGSNQPVRKSLLQEYVDANGYKGLNEKFAQQELANGGGFGATQAGLKYQSDGSVSYTILPTTVGSKNYYSFLASKGIYNQDVIRSVYGGQSRSDMLKKLSTMDKNSDEYKMLDWYANSDEVMTAKDYRDKIADAQRRLEEAQKNGQSGMDYDPVTGGYRIRNTNEADIKAITEEINGYKDSLWRAQNRETYGNLDSNADYDEKSKTIDEKLGTTFGITVFDKYIGTGDETYAYINDLGGRRTDDEAMRDMGGGTTESMKKYDFMTQKERDNYNYLYQAEGKKSAEKYLDYISYDLDARRIQSLQKQMAQLADDHPVLSSAASVPTNLMSGIGYLDAVRQKAARDIREIVTGEYTPINYNSVAMNPGAVTTGIRSAVAENLANEYGVIEIDEEKHPVMSRIFNGKSLGDVYQLGMSMADSAAIRLLVPFIGPSGTMLLGGSAATQGMLDAVARGASDEQAVTMGFMNGLFETLFEEISLDKLINGESRSILMSMAKQGFIEGSEEFFTTFANNIADLIVMAEKSGIGQNVAQYKALHPDWTEEQCRKQATIDAALDLFWDFTGGVITGGFMGGFESVSRISGQNKSAKQTYNGYDAAYQEALVKYLELTNDPQKAQKLATKDAKKATKSPLNNRNEAVTALVDEALELDPSNELAAKMKSRLESGKSVRGAQIYDLTQANEAAITALDTQTIQDSTEARLTELGEKANVEAIAKALAKEAAGQKLSTAERRAIENSTYGNRVRNELNPVNIESGEYSTAWAERMDTNRINAEEYSRLVEEAQIDPEVVSAAPEDNTTDAADKTTDDTTASPAASEAASALATGNDVVDKVVTKFAEKGEISGNDVRPILADREAIAALETAVGALDSKGKTGSEQRAIVRNAIARYVVNSRNTQNPVTDTTNAVDNPVDNTVENASATVETTTQEYSKAPSAEKTAAKAEIKVKRADKATKATGKKRGTVTGLGVKIADMKKAFNDPQGKAYKFLARFAEATGINIVLYSSKMNSIGQFTQEEGRFSWDEDTIYIDINSGLNTINDVGVLEKYTMLRTFSHEFVHFLEKWNDEEYNRFSDLVLKTMGEKLAAENSDITVDDLIRRKQEQYQQQIDENFTEGRAKREVVADAMTDILPYSNFMQELATENPNMVEKLISKLKEFIENLKSYYNGITVSSKPEAQLLKEEVNGTVKYAQEILDAFDSLAKGGVENYKQAMESDEVSTKAIPVEDTTQFSIRSLAQAGGFVAVRDEDGNIIVKRDGKKVSEVTTDDIDNSPIGALINYSLEKSYISDADAMAQKKLFADLLTMAAKSNDFAMAMQFAGSSVFTAIKSNSDSQYSTTYDFPSICTKTQAVIDSMSAAMKEKRGGLTKEEIEYIYNKVHNDGNPVPCPECYVFSRWVGIGGLLDNMWTYQNKYAGMTASEVQAEYLAMEERVKKVAEENNLSLGKAKGKLAAKFTKRFNELYERITKAENQGERVSEKDRAELAVLKDNMETVKSMTWIDKVYFKDSSHKTANPKKKWFVDPNVLFDLNEGESFATNYPEAWGFRTTQGAGYGKAITPYAEATLGEGILGTNNINKTVKYKKDEKLENIFLEQSGKLDSKARKVLDKATVKMRNQSFLGGQRFQSTSDARFENALDYLIACLEVQAMGGMVQVYTKVPGAVPAFAAWGFSTNQSLMPKGSGLDANGNPVDTSVGGMDPGVARANRDKFDTQGTITIGVNDNHIIALMDQVWRDFIIPYHASGGDSELIRRFREIQDDGKVEAITSTDYTRTQGDKILSDEVLRNYYKKTDTEIDLIHARRQARLDIFAMNRTDRYKRNPDMEIVRGSKYLTELYNRLSKGGEWEGVFQPKSIIEHQIFPNEFWDQTVSYEESGKITRDYLAYCEELGFLHRFSGMVPSNGTLVKVNGYDEDGNRVKLKDLAYKDDGSVRDYFWKTLTDRRMYDNEGKYLPQRRVSLGTTQASDVNEFAGTKKYGKKAGRQYDPDLSAKTAKEVSAKIGSRNQYALRDSDGNDLSTAQQEFFKDSEVRDDDGNLLVVYHATDADFNIFQRNKLGKSTLGNASSFDLAATSLVGHWFSDHDTSKQLGAKKVIKAYLNITRPYYTSLDGLAEEIGGYANDYNKAQERFEVSEFGLTRKAASEFVKHLRWEGYDGLIVDDREMGGTSYVVLDSNQVKSIDNKSPSKRKNIHYSLRSPNLSNMDLLLEAAEAVKNGDDRYGNLKEYERHELNIFTKIANELKDLQQRRLDLLAERRDILAAKGDREATSDENATLRRIQKNLNTTNAQIRKTQDEVIRFENYEVVKKILQQARGIVENESRQRGIDELKAYKAKRDERDSVVKYRESVAKNAKKLSDMLIKNTDKEHIPEGLKTVVGDFLSTIDFSSKRSMKGGEATKKDKQFLTTLNRLRGVLQRQAAYMADPENNQGGIDAYLDMPPGFVDEMDKLAQSVEETISGYNPEENHVNLMTGEQLKELNHILKVLHHTISTMNEFHANAHYASVEKAARDTILDTYAIGKDSGEMEKLRSFAYWENTLPYYAFKRMGGAAMSIFESLQDGWDKLAVNTKAVIDFSTKAYTPEEANAWASEVHEIKLSSGENVTMTTSQIMSLYCLAKREQARGHLFGGGMRVGNIDIEADPLKKRKKFTKHQTDPFTLTADDISTITSVLTDRQISVADKLQKYMNTVGTDWGNEVSMRRFGYRAFGEENYFPISSDKTNLPAVDPDKESTDLFRLLNMTMTKSLTDKANNALVVSDIFDVFANHMTDMAKYNALALPVLDAMKWYNYKSTTKNKNGQVKTQTVQRALESAYGKAANTYFINFIKDLNGSYESGRGEGFSSRMVSNYKVAAVGANLRVALLQPTAYVRASAVLNPKVMAKALTMKPAVDEMLKYSGTAVWKSLGFYDTNIGRGVRDQIKNAATIRDKVVEKSMLAAEWADKVTWGVIWNACKIDQHMQGVTEDKLMEATAKRFRDVIYATQVMDSTMTRSHLMRSKSGLVKLTTSFMSEPTMSYNILLDAYSEFSDAKRRGFNAWEKAGKKITVSFAAYAASQVAAAIVESLADALRDDDDYQTFLEKWNEAFFGKEGERMKGNLLSDINPLNKIPILKDVLDFSGYGNTRMDTEWINSIYEAWKVWGDGGKNRPFYGKIYKTLQAASRVIGLPISNASREVATIWNNTIGSMTGLKLKTYDAGEKNNLKYAYQDGYISEEDATSELLSQGLVKDENEAYWTIRSWESEDGSFSRYDRLYETVLAGKDARDAIEELTTYGYKEKEVISTLRGKIGEWYKDEESEVRVSRQEAMSMLVKYCGMSNDEAADKVTTWDYANLDADGSGGVSQIEAAEGLQSMDPYKAADVWDAFGWSSSYEEFVSDPKNIAKLDLRAAGLDYDESTWRNAMNESGLSDSAKDNLVTAFGGAALYEPYKAIRDCGFDPNTSMTILDGMDINGNNSVTQEEVYRYISENFDPYTAESIWDAIAKAKGWESKGVTRPYSYAQKKFR